MPVLQLFAYREGCSKLNWVATAVLTKGWHPAAGQRWVSPSEAWALFGQSLRSELVLLFPCLVWLVTHLPSAWAPRAQHWDRLGLIDCVQTGSCWGCSGFTEIMQEILFCRYFKFYFILFCFLFYFLCSAVTPEAAQIFSDLFNHFSIILCDILFFLQMPQASDLMDCDIGSWNDDRN